MSKANALSRKYKSQGTTAKSNITKSKKRSDKTLKSFFSSEHNLKFDKNIYKCLDIEPTRANKNKCQQQVQEKKPLKPPPLIITDKSCKVDSILNDNNISKYQLKILSIGTKIFFDNDNDLNKISLVLKQNNVDHFSHAPKDQKAYKVVLYGLPELPTEMIQEDLSSLNVRTEQVIKMTVKNPNPHKALYLIHLNAKESTFKDIQKIKTICHTLVKWSKYKPRSKGPTQCRNCTMYGHGTRNCFRKSACSLCASNEHSQESCPLRSLSKESTPLYKCSYCSSHNMKAVNHKANDINCPGRTAYIESREKNFQRNRNAERSKSNQQVNKGQFVPAPIPPPLTMSFKDVMTKDSAQDKPCHESENDTNNDLFSTAELLRIFMKAAEEIKKCRTKLDQIQVITNLLSYVV